MSLSVAMQASPPPSAVGPGGIEWNDPRAFTPAERTARLAGDTIAPHALIPEQSPVHADLENAWIDQHNAWLAETKGHESPREPATVAGPNGEEWNNPRRLTDDERHAGGTPQPMARLDEGHSPVIAAIENAWATQHNAFLAEKAPSVSLTA